MKKHLHAIDLLKGVLIICVITGHVLQGAIHDNLARFIIYGFHMPLFIAISGYLINTEKLKKVKIHELFNKYLYRVIIPWVIAFLTYFIIVNSNQLKVSRLINNALHPFYHLWYIPSLLFFILMIWLLSKINISTKTLLLPALAISVFAYFATLYFGNNTTLKFNGAIRPQFFFFLCFGNYLRSKQAFVINNKILVFLCLLSFGTYTISFYLPSTVLQTIGFFFLNITLITLIIKNLESISAPRIPVIEWMGVNSLPIYLWHVVPLLLLQKIKPVYTNSMLFYLLCIIAEIVVLLVIRLLSRIKSLNKFAFGN